MYTKPITYENLDGKPVTEVFQFNLTKVEAIRMNFDKPGGIEAYARKITEAEEYGELVDLFQDLIKKTYGRREGERFVKSQELWDEFEQKGAYSELFIELATNAQTAIEFFKGIVPKDMVKQVEVAMSPEKTEYTDDELLSMSWDDFYRAAGGKDDKQWDKRFLLLGYRRKNTAA